MPEDRMKPKLDSILQKYDGVITGLEDLTEIGRASCRERVLSHV